MTKRGRLVILIGIDGSGKSTLLSFLESKGYCVSHWSKLKQIKLRKPLNFLNPGEEIQKIKGKERLDFVWKFVEAELDYLINPALERGTNIISDGFFLRFLVKEKIYGKIEIDKLLKKSPLTGEEFVVMIDISPKVALLRKGTKSITPYELSITGDFIEFQTQQREMLLDIIKKFPHIVIDGNVSEEQLADKVLQELIIRRILP